MTWIDAVFLCHDCDLIRWTRLCAVAKVTNSTTLKPFCVQALALKNRNRSFDTVLNIFFFRLYAIAITVRQALS